MSITMRSFLDMAFSVLTLLCIVPVETDAANISFDERKALMVIGRRLGHRGWNFSVDPCSGDQGWVLSREQDSENAVNCSCNIGDDGLCHVTSIAIKAQSLTGALPSELVQLPFLQTIDLSRNFINDSIPRDWSSLPSIKKIALGGNRLSGPIPRELFSISSLEELVLEANRLSGSIPKQIGKLGKLKKLVISSNNFTGELPKEIGDLKNLEDLRISDNFFQGKVPDFIQNLSALTRLEIEATGLEGPIPPGISNLTNLTVLKISNINGGESLFPPLNGMINMKTLILRNCKLSGEIPDIFYPMQNLKILDLSFNNFSGAIPQSFKNLPNAQFMYLTGNMLSGDVPPELLSNVFNLDLSYNNYTWPKRCPEEERRSINYFGSSSGGNDECVQYFGDENCICFNKYIDCCGNVSFPCSRKAFVCKTTKYSLYINCGGKEDVGVKGIIYQKDMGDFVGAAASYSSNSDNAWAISSTGNFLDNDIELDNYTVTSNAPLSMTNAELYKTARISPLSLTYYGFCLGHGSYNVTLHFAEIVFTDDNTYRSLGKRIFDVYVQGKLIWNDFNIKEEAKYGRSKEVLKNITVNVNDGSLEIRLFWNGKGTTIIPQRGVYGPLISAISVSPNFRIPSEKKNAAAILFGVLVPIFCILIVVGILWKKGLLGGRSMGNNDLRVNDMTGSFTLRQIKEATNNFHVSNKIGEGGFGPVYKGILSEGIIIAVKQLSSKSKQGSREFVNEIGMISALQHPNLVKLYGCCIEGDQLLLVYEYMENNSLFNALFGSEEIQLKLDWQTRKRICVGIAKGLVYLHEESRLKIVHRDIKTTNILLDRDLNPKISDFGLAKLDGEKSHIGTRVVGTIGYMAPEYASRGYLTDKADVYSFGVVVLEVVSGKCSTKCIRKEALGPLQDWALVLLRNGSLLKFVDPKLGAEFNKEEALVMIKVALLCTDASFILRPSMSAVVSMLEGRSGVEEPTVQDHGAFNKTLSDPGFSNDIDGEYSSRNLEHSGYDCSSHAQPKSLVHSSSQSYPVTGSRFPSTPDLFSINLNSEHWEQKM